MVLGSGCSRAFSWPVLLPFCDSASKAENIFKVVQDLVGVFMKDQYTVVIGRCGLLLKALNYSLDMLDKVSGFVPHTVNMLLKVGFLRLSRRCLNQILPIPFFHFLAPILKIDVDAF